MNRKKITLPLFTFFLTLPFSSFWGLILGCSLLNLSAIAEEPVSVKKLIDAPPVLSFTPSNFNGFGVSCNGSTNGSVDLTVTGGLAPYTFQWSNGALTEDINSLAAGTYTVTVKDANNETSIDSIEITEPTLVVITLNGTTDVLCSGGSDGSVDITVSGGVPTYTFLWSNGIITEDVNNLQAGTAIVTATDLNGCTKQLNVDIVEPEELINSFTVVPFTCGNSNGSITANPDQGTPTYTYLWSTGATTQSISSLGMTGNYTVTITDFNGCSITDVATLTGTTLPLITIDSTQNVSCNNGTNGGVFISVTGASPFGYIWSNSSANEDLTNVASGNYTVTVTDANLCTATTTASITEPSPILIQGVITNVNCNGGTNGGVDISVSGGTLPYGFLWSNGATTEDITGVIAGTYTVTVSDDALCTSSQSFTVTQPTAISVAVTPVSTTCGLNNGLATANPSGGVGTFTYLWSNAATSQTINGLAAGTYTVTVTDQNLCTSTANGVVATSTVPVISLVSISNVSCDGGNNGGINISVSSGTLPYGFLWSNGATTEDITGVAAGTYTVTVTDGALCTATQSFNITQPTAINLTINPTNPSCGNNNGSATANPTGGTGTFTYLWSTTATTQTINGLAAGTYTVTVTDQNSCTNSAFVTLTNSSGPNITLVNTTNVSCNGGNNGAVNISVSGGLPLYNYLWSNGALTQDISNVASGTYTVTVTDALLCTATQSFTVTQPTAINASVSPFATSCGLSNGSATANAIGGTGTFTYLWSNAATTQNINGLAAGTYTVTVTDQNLCTSTANGVVASSTAPSISLVNTTNVSCNGGSNGAINISVANGTLPYGFLWSNGATTEDISGVVAGTYTITVTDGALCTASQSFIVTQPTVITVSVTPVSTACGLNNGSATANPSGGTGTFTYLWSTTATTQTINGLIAGTYTVTVTDQNLCTRTANGVVASSTAPSISLVNTTNVSCNGGNNGAINISVANGTLPYGFLWSNGATTEDISGVVAGTYTITVTDGALCTASQSFIVTQPTVITVSVTPVSTACGLNNGSATANPSGGTGTFTYLWSTTATTQTINNLAAGTYTVTVTDQNLCTKSANATVSSTGTPVITLVSITNVSCNGGANGGVDISVSGGTLPYGFLWSSGATTEDITGVIAGTYTVTVSDDALCSSSQSFTVTQPTAISVAVTPVSTSCGLNNGLATANPSGGVGTFTYLWSNAATSQTINGLAAGTYTVTVTDQNLCTSTANGVVATSTVPVISLVSISNVSCDGGNNGGINISVSSGTLPYGFLWSNGATTEDISGVAAGTYTVTVTDGALCTATQSFTVTQPTAISVAVTPVSTTCGLNNGSATANPSGGVGTFTYLWSNAATSQTINGLAAGTYTVTVTDQNLCTKSANATVSSTGTPAITLVSITNVNCNGGTNGGIDISVSGGTLPYGFLWSNGATTEDISGVIAGTYTVTVSDGALCTSSQSFTVTQPTILNDSINFLNATCGNSNGSVVVFPFGGTPNYNYQWSTGATTANISGLTAPQTYSVTITDSKGCIKVDSVQISSSPAIIISTDSIVAPKCFAQATGGVFLSLQGGTLPIAYQWSNSASQLDLTGVVSGIYTITVTDTLGCTASQIFTIPSAPSQLNDSISITDATCGNLNGSLTVFPFGGTQPYSYLWSNGINSQTISTLSNGSYIVTITDNNGCVKVDSAIVSSSGNLTLITDSVISPKCFGGTGSIYITLAGGSPGNYIYNWSNGVTIEDNIGVSFGTYTVTVTNNGCSTTQSFIIDPAPPQLLDSISLTNTTCGSNNGTASVFPYGGTGSFNVLWSNNETTFTIINLAQGTYVVSITDSNGCNRLDSVQILNDNAPVLAVNNIDEPLCYGGTGSITLNVSGGILPYGFLWSNGATDSVNVNITSGVYTCTVTGGNGCTSDFTVFLNQPVSISDSVQVIPENCGNDDGAATVFPLGGSPPFQYLWSSGETIATIFNKNHGNYIVTVTDFNQCTFVDTIIIPEIQGASIFADSVTNVLCHGQNTGAIYISTIGGQQPFQYQWSNSTIIKDLLNVPAGNYSLTITDANGCVTSFDTLITEPSAINKTITTTPAGCGLSNGTATVTGTGGVSPYTYLWFNGSTQTTITGLSASTYTVTVTDFNGCTAIDFALVSNTGGPSIIIDSTRNNRCYEDSLGAIFTTVTDGTLPYSLLWSNGKTGDDIANLKAGTYTLTVTDANNCVTIRDTVIQENSKIVATIITTPANCGSATGTAVLSPAGGVPGYTYLWQLSGSSLPYQTNLQAGLYPVKITDFLGCSIDTSAVITSPGAPQITLNNITNVTCYNGDNGIIDINISGGTAPYTYFWQNTFPAQTTQDATNLKAGTYIVNVTDTAGCSASFGFTVTGPSRIIISFNTSDPSCGNSNGNIASSVSGGNPGNYTYLWSNGSSATGISNIGAGSYTLTLTDSQGCTDSAVASLNNINGPEIIVTDSSNITCNGLNNGYINTQIISGTPPFNILWNPPNQNTPNISNLSSGIYTLTVTDALNCVAVRSVEIEEPNAINFNATIPINNGTYNLTCHGSNDGSITLFVSGGTPFIATGFPQYNYFWTPSGATTQSITGLPSGVFSVNIIDSLGCIKNASFTLTEPPFVSASAGSSFRICGTDSAQITATTPTYGTGQWTVLEGTGLFGNSVQNNTTVTKLSYGENTLAWVVSDGTCKDTAYLVITRDSIVQAFAGTDRNVCEPGLVLTATQPQFGDGIWEVIEGTGVVVSPYLAASPVTGMNYGNNIFLWTITNGNCIDDDTIKIIYNTPDECFDELEMPTGITPNGDEINDFFFVRGLDYDDNSIVILNRWGNVVFEKENYKNDWSGTSKTGTSLPDGTYYVILKVPPRNAILKGYVDIRR